MIPAVFVFLEEFRILKIDRDGVLFDVALLHHFVDDFFFREWAVFLDYSANDFFDHARHISPLGKRVETASDENESFVFDELVVSRRHMSLFVEKFLNLLRYFAEMNRRAVPANNQKGVVLYATRSDVR